MARRIVELEEHIAEVEAARENGDRLKPSDKAEHIAAVLVGMFSPDKAEQIAKLTLELLKEPSAKKPVKRKGGQYARS